MYNSDREKVEIYVSCRSLRNLDYFSKSDPQVRLYLKDKGAWKLFGTTETKKDDLNPNFEKTFLVDFIFEIQQPVMFEVVDIDSSTTFDMLGTVETTIGAIMGAKKQTSIFDLHIKGKKSMGKVIIRGERSGDTKNIVTWQWQGIKLMNTDGWFDKSDPFLRFFKIRAGGDLLQVHETEHIMDNLNPIWKLFQIVDTKLCNDHKEVFRVECWDWEKSGKHQYIGDCEVSIAMLRSGKTDFELRNPKKKKSTGTLRVTNFSLQEKPSFVDYLRGGTQLNTVVAIDFTGSNGVPSRPESLHALLPNGMMNQYQKAINSVCQIVLNYDFDQQVPCYGFGGKPHYPTLNMNTVSHCFPCSGNVNQQEVSGLQGIMDAYMYSLQSVELSGPTLFAPLITEACKACEINKQSENDIYTVLLILTDGEIHDMDATIDVLVKAAALPLSIIIVGIGNADFTKMEILDGDAGLCNSRGQRATRDLVQFVPFREFNGDMYLLAQHVLAEVPEQLVNYMRLVGKKPRPAQMVDINQLGYSTIPGGQNQGSPQQQQQLQGGGYWQNTNNAGMMKDFLLKTANQPQSLSQSVHLQQMGSPQNNYQQQMGSPQNQYMGSPQNQYQPMGSPQHQGPTQVYQGSDPYGSPVQNNNNYGAQFNLNASPNQHTNLSFSQNYKQH